MRPGSRLLRLAIVALLAAVAGCDEAGEGRVLSIDATGTVEGFVYFDGNGNRRLDFPPTDVAMPAVGVRLVLRGTRDTVARGATDRDGVFRLAAVPVGAYVIVVDSASMGDSLRIVRIDTEEQTIAEGDATPLVVTIGAEDTIPVTFALSFPKVTIEEARGLPAGRRVFVQGVALNSRATFGDSTVHLADPTAALRATRVPPVTLSPGDSVRLLGRRSTRDGQPTLDDPTAFFLGIAESPRVEETSTALAAAADGGRLDAALARVREATITDTTTVGRDFQVTADDGSGPLDILLDGDIAFATLEPYVPGAVIEAAGILIPTGDGPWKLKPRSDEDLVLP